LPPPGRCGSGSRMNAGVMMKSEPLNVKMIDDEEDLRRLLVRIKRACKAAGKYAAMEEFTIVRKLPPGNGPRVQFINGLIPAGYNPFSDAWAGMVRKHKRTSCKKRKLRKRVIA